MYTLILVVFDALEQKFGLVYTLLHRSFSIGSDFNKFHFEVETLKKTLHKNAYPTKFVDKCTAKFVNDIFVQKLLPSFQNWNLE